MNASRPHSQPDIDRAAIEARLAELYAKQAAATGWGAAVGARHEEIKSLEGRLRVMTTPKTAPTTSDDPTASAEWNEGCDFAMMQLCAVLDVDAMMVSWDPAAPFDGDVQAVIGNIMRAKYGEEWDAKAPHLNSDVQTTSDDLLKAKAAVSYLIDHIEYADSYGVHGSDFMACLLCRGGGAPGVRLVHEENCPVRRCEAIAAEWVDELNAERDGVAYSLPSANRLCSCKASQRDGQHMAWCPAVSSTHRGSE